MNKEAILRGFYKRAEQYKEAFGVWDVDEKARTYDVMERPPWVNSNEELIKEIRRQAQQINDHHKYTGKSSKPKLISYGVYHSPPGTEKYHWKDEDFVDYSKFSDKELKDKLNKYLGPAAHYEVFPMMVRGTY